MKGAYHSSWYTQFNVQGFSDSISSHFGGEEYLQPPFFPAFEQSQPFEADVSHAIGITTRHLASQTTPVELIDGSDPNGWSYAYKILISILLNAFPLVVAIGTSILSPAGKVLVKEFDTTSELTVLTTSLFMLVGGWIMRHIGPLITDNPN